VKQQQERQTVEKITKRNFFRPAFMLHANGAPTKSWWFTIKGAHNNINPKTWPKKDLHRHDLFGCQARGGPAR